MRNSLLTFLLLFAVATFTFAQSDTDVPTDADAGWVQGDILAGANTTLDNTSILNVQFSPEVGYALTDNDLVTFSVLYTDNDGGETFQRYQIGYQRSVWFDGFYVGAGAGIVDDGFDSEAVITGNVGYFRKLGNYWYVSPRVAFETYSGTTNLMTQLTFGFVL